MSILQGSAKKATYSTGLYSQESLTIWPSMVIHVANAPTLGMSLGDESPTNPHPLPDRA